MSGPNGEICRDCYFWVKIDDWKRKHLIDGIHWKVEDVDHLGYCYRIPHSAELDTERYDLVWCGEFKPLDKSERVAFDKELFEKRSQEVIELFKKIEADK